MFSLMATATKRALTWIHRLILRASPLRKFRRSRAGPVRKCIQFASATPRAAATVSGKPCRSFRQSNGPDCCNERELDCCDERELDCCVHRCSGLEDQFLRLSLASAAQRDRDKDQRSCQAEVGK